MSKKTIFSILAIAIFSIVITTNIAFAAVSSYTQLAPLPGTDTAQTQACRDGTGPCIVTFGPGENLGTYINGLYRLAVAAASVLAVVMIIMGGFSYVSSDAINNKEEGKSQIKSALGGLLLVLASYVILNTVNPQLISLKLVSSSLNPAGLEDFFNFDRIARERYDAAVTELNNRLTIVEGKAREMRAEATALQETLDGYIALVDQQAAGTLSPGQQAQLAALDAEIRSMGDVNGIQAKIDDLNQNANAMAWIEGDKVAADNVTNLAKLQGERSNASSFMGTVLGFNKDVWEPADFAEASRNLSNKYTATAAKIDSLIKSPTNPNGIYNNQSEADNVKNQLKTSTNTAIDSVCGNIGVPPKANFSIWNMNPIGLAYYAGGAIWTSYQQANITPVINTCKGYKIP